jgi:hypothetical protein
MKNQDNLEKRTYKLGNICTHILGPCTKLKRITIIIARRRAVFGVFKENSADRRF